MARKSKKRPAEDPARPANQTEDRRRSPAGRPEREAAEDAGALPREGRPGPVVGEEDITEVHRPSVDRDITDEDIEEGPRVRDPEGGLAIADTEEVEPDIPARRDRR
jgi:hypothetical protein